MIFLALASISKKNFCKFFKVKNRLRGLNLISWTVFYNFIWIDFLIFKHRLLYGNDSALELFAILFGLPAIIAKKLFSNVEAGNES
jgi:hypothetical protein